LAIFTRQNVHLLDSIRVHCFGWSRIGVWHLSGMESGHA